MVDSWLPQQTESLVASWDDAIATHYPQFLEIWRDPKLHLQALEKEWNLLRAVEWLDWDPYLKGQDLKVLDLGAGTGWLSIFLSRRDEIDKIYALDSCTYNLEEMYPQMLELMEGDGEKIKPIRGLFEPLQVSDDFFDLIVASSAVHHAPSLSSILAELHAKVKPGGHVVILNETPYTTMQYAKAVLRNTKHILGRLYRKQWESISPTISSSGLLYDPFLGDRAYCDWQWHRAIEQAGFTVEQLTTPLHPYQPSYRAAKPHEPKLTHFICRKPEAD